MATHAGSEGKVFIGSDQVAEIKSWSMEITSDTVDASIAKPNNFDYANIYGLFF